MKQNERIDWIVSIPFILIHVIGLLGIFFVPFSWSLVGLCAATFFVRMFGITAGYHRYFSHKSYKTSRFVQFLMAFLGSTSAQKGVLWWAANHRHHHKHSDQEEDIHSPTLRGFWWSHWGWILCPKYNPTQWELIPDLAKYPELVWLNRFHLVPPTILALAIFAIGGWPALIWGFFLSTVLLWHGTFTINSLSHVFGTRRYHTSDTSRNNWFLALITLGEGWHNNHHCYMNSANQGFFWWEVDMSYYLLKIGSWFGLFSHLKKAPLHLLESKRIHRDSSLAPSASSRVKQA